MSENPYDLASDNWPGMSKLIEEIGELGQVLGKLIGTGGRVEHWDGTNLARRLEEELGDVRAATTFFIRHNRDKISPEVIHNRTFQKNDLFVKWREDNPPLPTP